jgi:GNAT superfamily N-acetyltransferase
MPITARPSGPRTSSTTAHPSALSIRNGQPEDAEACHRLLWEAGTDLGRRNGRPLEGSVDDWWKTSESLHLFMAEHAAEWWIAEGGNAGQLIGYARSIERGRLFELTELFVRPGEQSRGVGRALLERAFPAGRGEVRSIIATTDVRALTRYYTADAVARFPIFSLAGTPAGAEPEHLSPIALANDARSIAAVVDLERAVLGYPRGEAEVRWLLSDRQGFVYKRGAVAAGFAFVGPDGCGPIAALDAADLPDMLRHVEARAHAIGMEKLELEVPGPNEVAIRHLLGRGFRLDPWINLLMSDRPFGQFDRFIAFSPPIFL